MVVLSLAYVPALMGWAQQTSDKQTLTILNDALNRYKTEGGSLAALTSGAPISNVMAKLGGTISWGGMIHTVMDKAQTYPARSISASGNGTNYYFTRYNSYNPSGAGSGGSHGVQSYTTPGTFTWTVPAGVTSVEVRGGGADDGTGNGDSGGSGGGGNGDGGGAGGSGQDGVDDGMGGTPGAGGPGVTLTISGSSVLYAEGGGGSDNGGFTIAPGGGSGVIGGGGLSNGADGGLGGNGCVIIKW